MLHKYVSLYFDLIDFVINSYLRYTCFWWLIHYEIFVCHISICSTFQSNLTSWHIWNQNKLIQNRVVMQALKNWSVFILKLFEKINQNPFHTEWTVKHTHTDIYSQTQRESHINFERQYKNNKTIKKKGFWNWKFI